MSPSEQWIDGFSDYDADRPLEQTFDDLGREFINFYKRLKSIPEIRFYLSLVQQQKFNDFFRNEKQRMKKLNGDLYTASSYRISWAALRIAMVLTALRMMDSGWIADRTECADTDLDTALSIIKTISAHNEYIFNVLNDGHTGDVKVSDTYSSAARNELLATLPDNFNSKDMQSASVRPSSLRKLRCGTPTADLPSPHTKKIARLPYHTKYTDTVTSSNLHNHPS